MGRHAHAGPGGALTRWDGLRGSLLSGRSHRGGLPCVLRQGRRAAADRAPWAGEATPIRTTNHQPPTTIEPSDPRRHDSPAARSSPDAPSSLCLPLAYPASGCMPRSQAEQRQQIDASTVGLQDVDLSAHENAMRGECLFASLAEAHALSHCAADQPPQRNSAMWAAACSLYEEVHGVLPTVDAMGLPMGPPTVAELRAVVASQFDENTWNTIRDSGLLEEDRYSYVADTVHSTRINIATDSVRGGAVGYWGDEMALAVLCRYLHLEPYVCAFEAADVCTRYSTPCRPDSAGDEADRRCVILSQSSSENSAGDHFHLLGQCSPEWPCGRTLFSKQELPALVRDVFDEALAEEESRRKARADEELDDVPSDARPEADADEADHHGGGGAASSGEEKEQVYIDLCGSTEGEDEEEVSVQDDEGEDEEEVSVQDEEAGMRAEVAGAAVGAELPPPLPSSPRPRVDLREGPYAGWQRRESAKQPGKFFLVNSKDRNEKIWEAAALKKLRKAAAVVQPAEKGPSDASDEPVPGEQIRNHSPPHHPPPTHHPTTHHPTTLTPPPTPNHPTTHHPTTTPPP